jgi:arabinofuranan 3-O-arabinosyltransferase
MTKPAPLVNDPGGWYTLLKLPAPAAVRVTAVAIFVLHLIRSSFNPLGGQDNALVVNANRKIFDGVSPYLDERFLYPPSSIPFVLPETLLDAAFLRHISPFIVGSFLLIGWVACLKTFEVGLWSWLGTLPMGAATFFLPANGMASLGSWTAPVAAASGVAILLMSRQRWIAAAIVIGISIAVKPMLMPFAFIFVLTRRWKSLAVAAVIPIAICAAMIPFIPNPELFFTKTIPFIVGGQDSYTVIHDSSLPVVLPRLGIPDPIITSVRVFTAVTCLSAAILRWRSPGDLRLRIVEVSGILMIGTFLISTPAFPHYAMIVVPALVASVVVVGSVARRSWFWLALLPLTVFFELPFIDYPDDAGTWRALKPLLSFTLLLLVFSTSIDWKLVLGRRAPKLVQKGSGSGTPNAHLTAEHQAAVQRALDG